MFFQIEDICAQHTDEAIRRTIGSLPRDLPATYQRALERVVRNHKAEVARKMFRWVAAAKRPLSLMEIREAIAVEPCQPFSQQDKLVNDVYQLIPWCGNLLALDEEEGLVQFAHHSVKDYLLSGEVSRKSLHQFRIRLREVDQEVGETCCTYLNFSDFERELIHFPKVPSGLDPKAIVETSLSTSSSSTLTSSLLRLNNLRKGRRATEDSALWRQLHLTSLKVARMWPQNLQTRYYFLAYASEYWLHHTSNFKEENQCWSLFRRLVLSEKATLATRPWSIEEWKAFGAKVHNYILETEHLALISLAIHEQPVHASAHLVRMVRHQCSRLCSEEMLQFLVNATRWVEEFWSTWDPVLIIAAERRRLDLVKQVIHLAGGFNSVIAMNTAEQFNRAPAHMDASLAQTWDSAWQKAGRRGAWEMLDLLLTYEAIMLGRLEVRSCEGLYAAALTGNVELTRRLLGARVDPNVVTSTRSQSSHSILTAAASAGSLDLVELLLHAGAEVNSQKVELYETALCAAAKQGKTLIVIALLAAGADVNANSGNDGLKPLAAAASHEDVKVLLLLAGAHFEGLAGCYQLQDCVDLGKGESMKRAKWLASLQCDLDTGLMIDYHRVYSSFPSKDRKFFDDMKNHVQRTLETEWSSIKFREAVAAFLISRMKGDLRKVLRREFGSRSFEPGEAASEKDLYELFIDDLQHGIWDVWKDCEKC